MDRPPERYPKGSRVEHYDDLFERFGKPWRPAMVVTALREWPGKNGPTWGVSVAHMVEGKPGTTLHLVLVDADGYSGSLRTVEP